LTPSQKRFTAGRRASRERVPTVNVGMCSRRREIDVAVDVPRQCPERGREGLALRDFLLAQAAPLALGVRFDALNSGGQRALACGEGDPVFGHCGATFKNSGAT